MLSQSLACVPLSARSRAEQFKSPTVTFCPGTATERITIIIAALGEGVGMAHVVHLLLLEECLWHAKRKVVVEDGGGWWPARTVSRECTVAGGGLWRPFRPRRWVGDRTQGIAGAKPWAGMCWPVGPDFCGDGWWFSGSAPHRVL
jgi:hypothetical protein